MVGGEKSTEESKRQRQAMKIASVKLRMDGIDSTLPWDLNLNLNLNVVMSAKSWDITPTLLWSVNQSIDKGASSWLLLIKAYC